MSCLASVYVISSHQALPSVCGPQIYEEKALKIAAATEETRVRGGGNRQKMKYHMDIITNTLC